MTDQTGSTRSQLYWNTLLKVPTQAATFVVSLIVARILMPGDYGVMGVAMMLIGYANLFTDFGFSAAIVQKGIRDDHTLRSIFTFNLALSTALFVLFSLSARFIAAFFKSPECESVVIVMSTMFVITSFSAVPRAILQRDLNFKTLSLIDISRAVGMSAVTLLLAIAHYGYWALALGQLIPTMVFAVYVCVTVGWVPAIAYRHSSMKRIMDFGLWAVLKTQLEFALGQIDKIVLGRYAGLTDLGYYDKAQSIAVVPNDSLITSLNAVLFSSFSQRKHDKVDLQNLFKKGLMTISVISFPIYMGLFIVARPFVVSLLGTKWVPMIVPLQIIAVASLVRSIGGLLVTINVAIGRYKAHTLRFAVAGAVFVISCFVLALYGPSGVALAFFLFSVLAVTLSLQVAVAAVGLSWADVFRACWPATKATACMLAVTGLLSLCLHRATLVNLIGITIVGAASYTACLALETNASFLELKRAAIADVTEVLKQGKGAR